MTNGADNHAGEELQVHCAAPWISVPQSIILDRNLSDAACRVIIYLLDRSWMKDWKIRIYGDVLPRFKISEYRWPKIRREMELAGYYKSEKIKSRNGSFTQIHHVYYPPHKSEEGVKPPPSYPGVGDSGLGHPGVGDSGAYSKQAKPKQKSSSTRVARVHAPADAGAAAAPTIKARRVRVSGLVTWYPEDVGESEILELQTPSSELESAVAAEHAAGRDPLPGRVACRLLLQRQAAQSAAAAEQVEARTARLDAESRARGERDMQELMALQPHQTTQDHDS